MSTQLKLLSLKEVASMLGVSKRTVDRMISGGQLPIVKVNRSTRITLAEIENYIERNTMRSGAA